MLCTFFHPYSRYCFYCSTGTETFLKMNNSMLLYLFSHQHESCLHITTLKYFLPTTFHVQTKTTQQQFSTLLPPNFPLFFLLNAFTWPETCWLKPYNPSIIAPPNKPDTGLRLRVCNRLAFPQVACYSDIQVGEKQGQLPASPWVSGGHYGKLRSQDRSNTTRGVIPFPCCFSTLPNIPTDSPNYPRAGGPVALIRYQVALLEPQQIWDTAH